MKPFVLFITGSLLFVTTQQNSETALKKELDSLKGTWKVMSVEASDKDRIPDFEGVYLTLSNDGKKFELTKEGETKTASFAITLDYSKKPKEITLKIEGVNSPALGIYKVEGDTLTLCYGRSAQAKRPTDFVLEKDAKHLLMVLKRGK